MKTLGILMFFGAALALTACTGLTQMQDTVAKFDQGAHSASVAEMSFLHTVQTSECAKLFYDKALEFSASLSPPPPAQPFSIDKFTCTNEILTADQLKIRQDIMDSLVAYADAIQSLANGTDSKTLSSNAQTLATNVNQVAQKSGFSLSSGASIASAALTAAIVTVTQAVLDHEKYKGIKEAAGNPDTQKALKTVVDALKEENLSMQASLQSAADSLSNNFQVALLSAREHFGMASFINVVQARASYQAIIPQPIDVNQMNATLDALVAANAALAKSKDGGAIPEISDLISRGQQANALFNSLKK